MELFCLGFDRIIPCNSYGGTINACLYDTIDCAHNGLKENFVDAR